MSKLKAAGTENTPQIFPSSPGLPSLHCSWVSGAVQNNLTGAFGTLLNVKIAPQSRATKRKTAHFKIAATLGNGEERVL